MTDVSSLETVRVERTARPTELPPAEKLGFGLCFSDHMFRAHHDENGWHDAAIVPRAPLVLDPAATVLQYSQCVFEGLKAFWSEAGKIRLFRPEFHARRFVQSAERICLPEVPVADFLRAVFALTAVDARFVPHAEGTSLYVRPTLMGTEAFLGVRPSLAAEFFVIASPVGAYWHGGRRPLRIWVETELVRAAPGGSGAAKFGGNYAASLLAAERAKARGFDQVLWTDARAHTEIEEIGTMNVFVRIGDTVLTPSLDGTILAGATRDCVLVLLREWGVKVEERRISLAEIEQAHRTGALAEMFGTGTASIVAPIAQLGFGTKELAVGSGEEGDLTRRLYDAIRGVQRGTLEDRHQWLVELPSVG
jgi:branched-chain amino acid aminotransferase